MAARKFSDVFPCFSIYNVIHTTAAHPEHLTYVITAYQTKCVQASYLVHVIFSELGVATFFASLPRPS